jgi:hypothetical protein
LAENITCFANGTIYYNKLRQTTHMQIIMADMVQVWLPKSKPQALQDTGTAPAADVEHKSLA